MYFKYPIVPQSLLSQRSIKVIKKLFDNIPLNNLNDIIVQYKIDEYSDAGNRSKTTTNNLLTKLSSSLTYSFVIILHVYDSLNTLILLLKYFSYYNYTE